MSNFSAEGGSLPAGRQAPGGKNKNELTFIGIGILMVIIVVSMFIWAISFLTGNISDAMEKQGNGPKAVIQFQVDRAEAVLKK